MLIYQNCVQMSWFCHIFSHVLVRKCPKFVFKLLNFVVRSVIVLYVSPSKSLSESNFFLPAVNQNSKRALCLIETYYSFYFFFFNFHLIKSNINLSLCTNYNATTTFILKQFKQLSSFPYFMKFNLHLTFCWSTAYHFIFSFFMLLLLALHWASFLK